VLHAKRSGNKSRLYAPDAESFLSEIDINSSLITAIIAMLYSAAKIVRTNGLAKNMDSNAFRIILQG